ncbi:MAG TPA: hypothetical protein VNW97_17830 [Candidatus Saccharimonadales bacterium]|nr:hypothetical protein [Candidatus Saccharimonadales bacterium]
MADDYIDDQVGYVQGQRESQEEKEKPLHSKPNLNKKIERRVNHGDRRTRIAKPVRFSKPKKHRNNGRSGGR